MKFPIFSVSENGKNGVGDEGADGAMLLQNFWARTAAKKWNYVHQGKSLGTKGCSHPRWYKRIVNIFSIIDLTKNKPPTTTIKWSRLRRPPFARKSRSESNDCSWNPAAHPAYAPCNHTRCKCSPKETNIWKRPIYDIYGWAITCCTAKWSFCCKGKKGTW